MVFIFSHAFSFFLWAFDFRGTFCNTIVLQIRIIKDRDSGESKGYAFILFKTKEAAQKAIEDLHGKEVKVMLDSLRF